MLHKIVPTNFLDYSRFTAETAAQISNKRLSVQKDAFWAVFECFFVKFVIFPLLGVETAARAHG